MLDRNYFEQVLQDQLRLMERPVRLKLHLGTGDLYMVHALVAAHDGFVILKAALITDMQLQGPPGISARGGLPPEGS